MTATLVAPMIRWRLRQVMADRNISNKTLAELIGLHRTSVSNLKRRDSMPRVDGELLESLCKALECSPSDLIEYKEDK